ncbi:MAG: hypothetical protein COV33_01910 [Candidatus Zambryskibacteria bacterium CG10_big_fil_rev_8_21_14_0_10_34_34]|uniref:HTH arsR-type domain-containing protein n=1 Tax=Candidatus Zambryskibacteria bacterium CG10_big_fil_rev_8_21_14_0_10_34_34 TaxID=1975114 RepID=A0A2H0R0N9_9BACT|nr:MAG: hypothetical protein COV33_01910 [Candidatus Zambryskibacteria bacterium CG10_big_fil_rev_8_21_14_0_10_34_34]
MGKVTKNKMIRQDELMVVLKMLANKHRLAILKLLKEKREKSVGQIADCLEVSFNTISKNLLYLSQKGILVRRYDTPFVLYKISNSLPKSAKIIISKIL